jgi:caffeoyl-CoA O-methyltransferase
MQMTPERWHYLAEYSREVFGAEDDVLGALMPAALERGLPDISVGPDVGRLLMLLTQTTPGRLAIEVGTLGGYSGIWIARGLRDGGRLITIEPEALHADFATEQFARAGVGDRVEVRRSAGLDVLPALADELGPGSVDVVFIDAIKTEYPDYWRLARPLIAPGGYVIADNALGSDNWTMDTEDHPSRRAIDELNRMVAADDEFEAVAVPLRNGVLVGRRQD